MHAGSHFGSHLGAHLGAAGAGTVIVIPGIPDRALLQRQSALFCRIERTGILVGALARSGTLRALLQEIGASMIDIIGPIQIERGDTLAFQITVTDDEDEPIDLTGYEIEVEVKPELDGPDPAIIAKSVGDGVTLLAQVGATIGKANVLISSTDNSITSRLYWLDVVAIKDGVRTHVITARQYTILPVADGP